MGKVLKRLKKQEQIEGLTEDLILVKKWYEIVASNSASSNMFHELVKVKHYRYGKMSYESYAFYYPTNELKSLVSLK